MKKSAKWSSEKLGWVVCFKRQSKQKLDPKKRLSEDPVAQDIKKNLTPQFQKLEDLVSKIGDLKVVEKLWSSGLALVTGKEAKCLELKSQIESLGIATMSKNELRFKPARS